MKFNGKVKINKIEFMTNDTFKMTVVKPEGIDIKAGQFFMIKNIGLYPLLNRPISVSFFTKEKIEFGIKIAGKETKNMSKLNKGDEIYLLGPLGNGFELKEKYNKVLLVGGGIGIEPLKAAAMELEKINIETKSFLGFKNECFDIKEFKNFSDEVITFSEEENVGDFVGYPTDKLIEEFEKIKYDAVFTCGPKILMDKTNEICKSYNIEVQLLLEEKMACGIGACLGCTCKTVDGYKKVCKDGPMFYGNEVI
jgi:dihydroorotate dehydrogenase electron transfer subunit